MEGVGLRYGSVIVWWEVGGGSVVDGMVEWWDRAASSVVMGSVRVGVVRSEYRGWEGSSRQTRQTQTRLPCHRGTGSRFPYSHTPWLLVLGGLYTTYTHIL